MTTRLAPSTPAYTPESSGRASSSGAQIWRIIWWCVVLAAASYFAWRYTVRYFHYTASSYGPFWWPRARVLLPHVIAGMTALFLGPVQFWSAMRRKYARLHRWSGRLYVAGVVLGSVMAWSLVARMPAQQLGHQTGLGALGIAWLTTTAFAFIAIRRGNIAQHREWMIRSYVVTFAFVTYRALLQLMQSYSIGAPAERTAVLAWSCWALPLLVTEVVLQGRKLLRAPVRALPPLPD